MFNAIFVIGVILEGLFIGDLINGMTLIGIILGIIGGSLHVLCLLILCERQIKRIIRRKIRKMKYGF